MILSMFLSIYIGGLCPWALLYTIGIRSGKEQRDLKLGDISIGKDSSGDEFIQHVKERQTKTSMGEDPFLSVRQLFTYTDWSKTE
jgi:hypothetical protein